MSSRYAASAPAPRKKSATYGMSSRKRRIDNVAPASEFRAQAHREQEPSRGSALSDVVPIRSTRERSEAMLPTCPEPQPSSQRTDAARSRAHATTLDLDAPPNKQSHRPFKSPAQRKVPRPPQEPLNRDAHISIPASPAMRAPTSQGRPRPSPMRPGHKTNGSLGIDISSHLLDEDELAGPQTTQPPVRRRRLIDALAAQRVENSDPEIYEAPKHSPSQSFESSQDDASQLYPNLVQSRRMDVRGMSARKKIRFTYSQSRSILGSSSNLESSGGDAFGDEVIFGATPGRMSTPPRSSSPFEELEEGENTKHAIQSVHELRRAGAKNRFSDEMDDLLSRIGAPGPSPSTMRRNGLCELVQMLQKEEFATQFRDHAARDNIARGIQDEKDIVSAFALTAVLVIFLSSNAAPHLLRQLAEDRIGLWLGGLFANEDDVTKIAAQRSTNVSKATRSSLSGVKKILLQMPIWHKYAVSDLSPRTLALQLLNILIRSTDDKYLLQIVSDSGKDLAALADTYRDGGSTDDLDFALLISILETQSGLAAMIGHQMLDMQQQASRVAGFLQVTLERWPTRRGELDAALLKLATNTTNHEIGSVVFNHADLLSSLADCICSGFGFVKSAMGNARFESSVYDELLLILGIMINVVEHCADARSSAQGRPLECLVTMWLENQTLMNEADSVDKSKLSIALGYLAVLLGYLFLSPANGPARTREIAKMPSIGELVTSIQEFIVVHKSVDSRVHELEGLVTELRRQEQQERRQFPGR